MGKIVGIVLVLGGIAGVLYQWIEIQKERQKRVEEFVVFIHKLIFAMETEKVKLIDYFTNYESQDMELSKTLKEVAARLRKNMYPSGQSVWEAILKEEEKNWDLNKDMFEVILKCGTGFFGRSRDENISFLKKQLEEIKGLQMSVRDKDTKERKVWIPVSMLGGVMVVILFL